MLGSMGLFHFSICIIVIWLEGGGIEMSSYILVYVVIGLYRKQDCLL